MTVQNSPSPSSICPAAEEIREYAVGGCGAQRASELESHLLNCAQCETLLDGLDDPSDAVIHALASLPPSADDEDGYRELRDAVLTSPAEFTDTADVTARFQRASRLADPDLGPLPCRLGNYELNVCIGRGASGAVYRARHIKLDQIVAVKVLDSSRSFSVAAFLQEMKTIGPLAHPNVIRATDAGEADGLHFLVMEYVEGIDAARLLFRNGPLRPSDAAEIARQAALGLQFVHERGLVHRDIKPSNLLVTVDGQVKLLDLGISTRDEDTQFDGQTGSRPQGTLDYMAPEQWNHSSAVGSRSDLYSLGCTLFKLLTGNVPSKQLASLRESGHNVPRNLERLLRRLLSADPDDRPAAHEVADVLRSHTRAANLKTLLASVSPKSSAPPRSPTTPFRWLPSNVIPRRIALGGVAAAGIAAALLSRRTWLNDSPQLRRIAWRPLRPVKPKLLLSMGNPEHVQYDINGEGDLSISSDDISLIHLGRPVSGIFTLAVDVRQDDWQSGGVFFQGQFEQDDDRRVLRFQTVELTKASEADLASSQRRLQWSQWTAHRDEGRVHTQQTPLAEIGVELLDRPIGQRLQVTCGREGMPEIEWNGNKLHESMWNFSIEARNLQRLSPAQRPTAYLGRLGVVNVKGTTTFIQPRLAYL